MASTIRALDLDSYFMWLRRVFIIHRPYVLTAPLLHFFAEGQAVSNIFVICFLSQVDESVFLGISLIVFASCSA
jgi:hypothetical protein